MGCAMIFSQSQLLESIGLDPARARGCVALASALHSGRPKLQMQELGRS
jgi:hypothetical protein